MSKSLGCLLRVSLVMWIGLVDVFRQFHYLKVTKEVESLIVASLIACLTQLTSFLGRPGRRGCYRLASKSGCTLLG